MSEVRPWRVRRSTYPLDVPWYRVRCDEVELPDGSVIDYYLAERQDIGVVFALTPAEEVLLVRQYKHGAAAITIELPGGLLDDGEAPVDGAARELREETGYATDRPLEPLPWVWADSSKADDRIHAFIARDVREVGAPALDPNEAASGVAVERVPVADIGALIDRGEIASVATVVTILQALRSL